MIHIIAIGGPSCAGKTELSKYLAAMLSAPILPIDAYYINLDQLTVQERSHFNFDEPTALDHYLLRQHIEALAAGRTIERPTYDFRTHTRAAATESDIRQAGLAATKRAYAIYRERGYQAVLLIAALRGDYHLTELAGADLLMSIAPAWQDVFVTRDLPREERIGKPIPDDAIERLRTMPEFVRAYEPDGMTPAEFMGFGATQRTLGQFVDMGWRLMENYR